jgi:hypothetical protein
MNKCFLSIDWFTVQYYRKPQSASTSWYLLLLIHYPTSKLGLTLCWIMLFIISLTFTIWCIVLCIAGCLMLPLIYCYNTVFTPFSLSNIIIYFAILYYIPFKLSMRPECDLFATGLKKKYHTIWTTHDMLATASPIDKTPLKESRHQIWYPEVWRLNLYLCIFCLRKTIVSFNWQTLHLLDSYLRSCDFLFLQSMTNLKRCTRVCDVWLCTFALIT